MKIIVSLLLLSFSISIFSQQKEQVDSLYFPLEQLVHPDCKDAPNKNKCIDSVFEAKLLNVLLKEKKSIRVDTLKAFISFSVDYQGKVLKKSLSKSINGKGFYKKVEKKMNKEFDKLPSFNVKNPKSRKYPIRHAFRYTYLVKHDNSKELARLDLEKSYEGGYVQQVPLFQDCKRVDDITDRMCFQEKIRNHIAKNFSYPKEAQAKGIQGRVSLMFTIDKQGKVTNLRTRSSHKLLDEEARRIINLLPDFQPGLRNGNPVRVPYSIPITFKL